MIVLSYGMTKSGSTLAFELCKAVLERRGFAQRILPDGVVAPGRKINFINRPAVPVLRRLLDAVPPQDIIAVKVHAPLGEEDVRFIERMADRIKVQVNLRDPREICLSLMDAGTKAREKGRPAFSEIHTLDEAADNVNKQFEACRRWAAIAGALHLLYNDVAYEPASAVARICEQFGFAMLNAAELKAVFDHVFDAAFTQKNKAVKDRYRTDLTPAQNEALLDRLTDGRDYIARVFEQRDFGWFARTAEA